METKSGSKGIRLLEHFARYAGPTKDDATMNKTSKRTPKIDWSRKRFSSRLGVGGPHDRR